METKEARGCSYEYWISNYPEVDMLPMLASELAQVLTLFWDINLLWFPIMINDMTQRIIIGETQRCNDCDPAKNRL